MSSGSLVRAARQADGLSQAQLAARLGITQPSVAKLEASGDAISLVTLRRALHAMGRTLELRVARLQPSYDESLLIENLRLTPAERIRVFEDFYADAGALAAAGARARSAA
jgi:transcriptional regulator with XRE-family HTH domain